MKHKKVSLTRDQIYRDTEARLDSEQVLLDAEYSSITITQKKIDQAREWNVLYSGKNNKNSTKELTGWKVWVIALIIMWAIYIGFGLATGNWNWQ